MARRCTPERLVEGAPSKAERRRADGRAEHVERRHRDLEALARPADALRQRHAAALEAQRRERMRRDRLDALRDHEPRRIGVDDEGRQPLRARRLAGAGEDDVVVGDAAVRDEGFFAVDAHVLRPVRRRRGGERRDVGARLGLGERERRDRLALADRRQIALLQRLGAEQRDRRRCPAPAWRRRNRRARRRRRASRGQGTACARRSRRSSRHRPRARRRAASRPRRGRRRGAGRCRRRRRDRSAARSPPPPRPAARARSGGGAPRRTASRGRTRRPPQFPSNTGFSFAAKAR